MAFAKFQGIRCRIDGEIAENHAILVNLTASIGLVQAGDSCAMLQTSRSRVDQPVLVDYMTI